MIGSFENGKQHDEWNYWYPNGKLYYKGQFEQIKFSLDKINQQIEDRKNINNQLETTNEAIEKLRDVQQIDREKSQKITENSQSRS